MNYNDGLCCEKEHWLMNDTRKQSMYTKSCFPTLKSREKNEEKSKKKQISTKTTKTNAKCNRKIIKKQMFTPQN